MTERQGLGKEQPPVINNHLHMRKYNMNQQAL